MKPSRNWIISAIFVLIAVAMAVWLYPQLPARVPVHWDLQGHANGWAPRFWAVATWPLVIVGLAVLAWLLPRISPRRFEIKPFAGTYGALMLVIQAFLLVVGVCALLAGAGYAVPIPLVATIAVGVLFMVLGNYMGKLRKNFFIGIRTPWTLTSEAVWERTHRMAGWWFVVAGLAWIAAGLARLPPGWLIAIALAAGLVPCAYSYFAYRRLEGNPRQAGDRS